MTRISAKIPVQQLEDPHRGFGPPGPRQRKAFAWRAFAPGAVIGAGVALALAMMWWLGVAYELEVDSGLQVESVVSQPVEPAAVAEMRERAKLFARRADSVETQALGVAADDSLLDAYRKRADLYREWSGRLEARAFSSGATLATREARQILWVYSVCLDLLVCIVGGFVALGLALRSLGTLPRARRVPPRLTAGLIVAAGVLALAAYFLFVGTWYDYQSEPYLLARAALGPRVIGLVRFDDGLHMASSILFGVAGFLLLARLKLSLADAGAPEPRPATEAAREIAESMRVARFGLFVGAAMLVVYVATVSALFHWTLAFVDPGREALFASVQALTRSAVTARSILSSTLVVALYAPVALTLRLVAIDVAARALPDATVPAREEWMKEHGLASTSSFEHLKTLAAILAPVITGPLADLLQSSLG